MSVSSPPKISVCIVTYKRDADLLHSLSRLGESTFEDYEILIVDNGPSTELRGLIEAAGLKNPWTLIDAPDNGGCANLNLLFQRAKGEVVACFDDDSFPARDCLEKTWDLFQKDGSLGMIGYKMHLPESGEPWHDPWWNPNSSEPRETVLCPGCGMAFRNDSRLPKELCIPDIVSQAHELSIAAEIARLGYRIEFRPECVAYHPDTTLGYDGKKAEGGRLNQLRFLARYADPKNLRLLMLTHWLVKFRGLPDHYDFLRSYVRDHPRKALDGPTFGRFREVMSWHIHPWLKAFLPR